MPSSERKMYRVYENNITLLETDNRIEAIDKMKSAHRINRTKFHEVHRWHDDDLYLGKSGYYSGIFQLAPNDCSECGRKPDTCKCVICPKCGTLGSYDIGGIFFCKKCDCFMEK